MFLTIASGVGHDMWVVILGRAISGMGGAGTMTISSIIITGETERRFKLDGVLTRFRYCSPA
jgi:MFS family permease